MNKPFSQASENNKRPILNVLSKVFADRKRVLEIGSGTGQHAVYFAEHLPHLNWQTSDLQENHSGIRQWMVEKDLANLKAPIELNVANLPWPIETKDAVYTANTLHIMSWQSVQNFFLGLERTLEARGLFAAYGPFNYRGGFTSDSNRQFDAWLKQRGAHQGIRDFEALNTLAENIGLMLKEDNEMPANNRLLIWQKQNS